jgi:hypothetical protein
MRAILLAVLVTLGIGLVGTSGASATPATGLGFLYAGADQSAVSPVHCRRYLHAHRWHRPLTRVVRYWHRCG